jgi:hypothetical protein
MSSEKLKNYKVVFFLTLAIMIPSLARAGTLDSSGSPGATMVTLTDIKNRMKVWGRFWYFDYFTF